MIVSARPVRNIVVIGGGLVAASAALSFARALPFAKITLIATPVPATALADRLPRLWPSAAPFLQALGLSEAGLLQHGLATPVLARRFYDWGHTDDPWFCPEGEAFRLSGFGAVHQRWLQADPGTPFHDLFPATALARLRRFSLDALTWPELAQADVTLAFAPDNFGTLLAEGCRRAGVAVYAGRLDDVEPGTEGGWQSVRLIDRRVFKADLFVWAGGGPLPDENWTDWSCVLPADRLALIPAAPVPLIDDYHASEWGWHARLPCPGKGYQAIAFNSEIGIPEDPPSAKEALALRPGRAARMWTGNVLRLGDGAAQLGPLGLAGFTLAAHQMLLALELLPGSDMPTSLTAEFDRRAAMRAEHLCDFLAVHYLVRARHNGPFWAASRPQEQRPSLATLLAQFQRRGHLPHRDEDTVPADMWRAVLLGQGLHPELVSPVTLGADPSIDRKILADADLRMRAAAARAPVFSD